MTLWFVLALMTAVAVFAVLWPLSRRGAMRSGNDIAVYKDQLEEIERDRASGRIGAPEAEAARIEVSRRLLAADAAAVAPTTGAASVWRRRAAALAALVLLPAGVVPAYLALGSPGRSAEPLAARLVTPPEQASFAVLLNRIESHLARNPDDGRGWEVVAPIYVRLGRFDEAVQARRNALRLLGATADREADLGEALLAQANGIITAEAKACFDRALALDAKHFKARFFVGLAAEQDGRPAAAAAMWRDLLAGAPPDAPWAEFVRHELARVEGRPASGPSDEDVAASAELTPDQRTEMVRGMVQRLAERLERDGSDLDGWVKLVRAYTVLGDGDRARTAVVNARRALASEPDKLRRLDQAVQGLGLGG
jgi:cytochrome c-type biogenesis protein CcmH